METTMPTTKERPSRALLERPSTFTDPNNYPAISLHQPYAGLIHLAGRGFVGKELETRTMNTAYRGPLVICSAKRIDFDAYNRAKVRLVSSGLVDVKTFEEVCGPLARGYAMAVFHVNGCREMKESDHEMAFTTPNTIEMKGRIVWTADRIDALCPFEVSGAQGFFRVPRAKVDAAIQSSTTPKERVAVRKSAARKLAANFCRCGKPLPKHLAEFMNNDPRAQHACACGRSYRVQRSKFVAMGTTKNPFAEVRDDA